MPLGTAYIPDQVPSVSAKGTIVNTAADVLDEALGAGNYVAPTANFSTTFNGVTVTGINGVPIPANYDLAKFLVDSGCPVDYTADLPVITGPAEATGATSSATIDEGVTAIHTFTATKSVSWSLDGADVALFHITQGGALSFKEAPEYATPLDADENGVYEVDVRCIDTFGNVVIQAVSITVAEVTGG